MQNEAPPAEPHARVTSFGKQVMLDGRHLCDAVTEDAANAIRLCLERAGAGNFVRNDEAAFVEEFFA